MSESLKIEANKTGVFYRTFEFDASSLQGKEDDRTVELSFSSEAPVIQNDRDIGFYREVLDHSPESVDMSRLRAGAPLLLGHDKDRQIGVVEEAVIGADRKGRARVRFGKSELAREIFEDVKDGIRRLVSVGYRITKLVPEKVEEAGMKTLRAVGWQPMEVSIVSVPADISVGVGREDQSDGSTSTHNLTEMKRFHILRNPTAEGGGQPAAPITPETRSMTPATAAVPAVPEMSSREAQREMFNIATAHGMMDLYGEALTRGVSLQEFQKEVLKKICENSQRQSLASTTPASAGNQRRSLGEIFTTSEAYRNAIKVGGGAHRGVSIELPDLNVGNIRATLLTTTGLTSYDRPPGIVTLGQQPLMIAQLFAQGTTSAATIRVTQEVTFTNAATAVAEEGQKPEASFDLVETDFGVKKIAVIGRVSDEMFADFPQVQSYVNSRLIYMVGALEDNHLLNGTGLNNQITGILATGSIQTVNAGASATPIDAIFKAMTKVSSVGFFQPDYIVVNHTDWQNIKLTKDQSGQYYAGGPFSGAYGVGGYTVAGTLWGLPVVATNAIAQGTALVGAFQLGAQLFRREGIRLDTTNSDASDFVYNRIAIRVEERLALAVYRPLAFCTVTNIPNVA